MRHVVRRQAEGRRGEGRDLVARETKPSDIGLGEDRVEHHQTLDGAAETYGAPARVDRHHQEPVHGRPPVSSSRELHLLERKACELASANDIDEPAGNEDLRAELL